MRLTSFTNNSGSTMSILSPPGGILMYGALVLFESEFVHVVAISFTALILTELLMVALTIRTWHWLMVVAEFFSLGCYLASLAFLNEYFGTYLTSLLESSSDHI